MADTEVTDAATFPTDEGLGSNFTDGQDESWDSAALLMLLGQCAQSGSYVRSDSELDFGSHDAGNDTVDVNPGVAYISLAGETLTLQSGKGGVNSPPYDTTLTVNTMPAIAVVVPTAVTVDCQDSTLSQVWLAYDTDGTGPGDAGSVYLRSDDTGGISAPSHPSVELGSANPDSASADTLANRFPTWPHLGADELTIAGGPSISEPPGRVNIDSQSPSGVATVDLTTGIDSDHEKYVIEINDFVPATDNVALQLQVSTDGGSSWKSGASDYEWMTQELDASDGGETTNNSSGDSSIQLFRNVGSSAGEGCTATIKFSNPANGSLFQMFYWDGVTAQTDGTTAEENGYGSYLTAEAIDAVRLQFDSGNIESGDVTLEGVVS